MKDEDDDEGKKLKQYDKEMQELKQGKDQNSFKNRIVDIFFGLNDYSNLKYLKELELSHKQLRLEEKRLQRMKVNLGIPLEQE